jgi:hypothetical protein
MYEAWRPRSISHINIISLPNLKRLHVRLHQSTQPILDFLTVPILECLHILVILIAVDTALSQSLAALKVMLIKMILSRYYNDLALDIPLS